MRRIVIAGAAAFALLLAGCGDGGGVAARGDDLTGPADLLRAADEAQYRAKRRPAMRLSCWLG